MSAEPVDVTRAIMRFLLWLLGIGMVTNYVLAEIAYGDAPAYLVLGGGVLLAYLVWTHPTVRRWMS